MPYVRRIAQPAPGLWSLALRDPAVVLVIACVRGRAPALELLQSPPEGEQRAADAQTRLVRERLEGGLLESLRAGPGVIELWVRLQEHARVLRADAQGLRVLDEAGDASLPEWPVHGAASALHPEPAVLVAHRRMLLELERAEAGRLLRPSVRKLRNRIGAIERDELRAAALEAEAARARSLVAAAARARRGATTLEAIDWSSGEPVTVSMKLDPARPARAQLEAVFARARRMKRGELMRGQRAAEAQRALAIVDEALRALDTASSVHEVRGSLARGLEALPAGVRARGADLPGAPGPADAREQRNRRELTRWARQYEALDGTRLLVGRDARGNDMLTTRVARPHDVWMHVRGQTGSHVLIVLERGAAPGPEALLDAATLAAHFSDARGSDRVELSWCERRHVRKPRGAPPGQVTASREKTLLLRFEPDRLQRLLSTVR